MAIRLRNLLSMNKKKKNFLTFLFLFLLGLGLNAANPDYVYSEGWFDNLGDVETTFFFDGNYYIMGTFTPLPNPLASKAGLWKCNLTLDGKIESPVFVGVLNNDIPYDGLGRYSKFSSVVYNGEVYIFYLHNDNPTPLMYGPLSIFYIKSSSPENISSWSQPVDTGIDVNIFKDDLRAVFDNTTIKAVVFNKQIYLFSNNLYNAGCAGPIYYSKFDGKTWNDWKTVLNSAHYYPYYFVTTCVQKDGSEKLILGGVAENSRKLSVYEINSWDDFSWILDQNLDGIDIFGPADAVAGSVITGRQDNMLQIFFNTSSFARVDLRQCEMSVERGIESFSSWRDTGISTHYLSERAHRGDFNITNASLLDSMGNVQTFFIVSNRHWPLGPVGFYAFKSDAFLKTYESVAIDTGIQETKEEGAWSVLGVIEGVPPFSRNGNLAYMLGTSSVSYGKSQTMTASTEMKYDFNVSGKGGIGFGKGGINGSFKYAFNAVNKSSKSIRKSFNMNLSNTNDNINGDYGWLIVSKPLLKGRKYKRIPANDENISLGEFSLVTVEDASILFESYTLANPPASMLKRMPSSDFKSWQKNEFVNYEGIQCIQSNGALTADTNGGSGSIDIGIEKEFMHTSSNAVIFNISASAAIKLLQLSDLSGQIGIESRNSAITTISDKVSAKLDNMPLPPVSGESPYIKKITVKPVWYVPNDNTSLKDIKEKPYWISEAYAQNNLIPWCISWKVTDFILY